MAKKIKSFKFSIPVKVTNIVKIPAPDIYTSVLYSCNINVGGKLVMKKATIDADSIEDLKKIVKKYVLSML